MSGGYGCGCGCQVIYIYRQTKICYIDFRKEFTKNDEWLETLFTEKEQGFYGEVCIG